MSLSSEPPCRMVLSVIGSIMHRGRAHHPGLGIICLLALFLTFLPFIGNAEAADGFEVTGTVSIRSGYYSKLPFVMAVDGVFEFDIEVRSGSDIDVILIPYSELSDYQNGNSYTYYPDGTFSDCDEADGNVYLDSGTYCLILSNDGNGASSVHYSYTPTALQGDSDDDDVQLDDYYSSSVIVIIAFFIAVICLVLIYYVYGTKKDKVMERERKQNDNGVKYCERCGASISDDSSYCKNCGGRIR